MSNYTMPVLSEQEREEAISSCEVDLLHLQMTLEASEKAGRSNAPYLKKMVLRHKIALAALTAEPVAWEIAGRTFSTKEDALEPGFVGEPEPLYDAPPVPVKQEGGRRD